MITKTEMEILRRGKNQFYEVLDRYKVPVDMQVMLWDTAFRAGRLVEHDSSFDSLKKFVEDTKKIFFSVFLILLLPSCAKLHAEGRPTAERVFSTEANYVCFIVRDETGKAVGGNCLAD